MQVYTIFLLGGWSTADMFTDTLESILCSGSKYKKLNMHEALDVSWVHPHHKLGFLQTSLSKHYWVFYSFSPSTAGGKISFTTSLGQGPWYGATQWATLVTFPQRWCIFCFTAAYQLCILCQQWFHWYDSKQIIQVYHFQGYSSTNKLRVVLRCFRFSIRWWSREVLTNDIFGDNSFPWVKVHLYIVNQARTWGSRNE